MMGEKQRKFAQLLGSELVKLPVPKHIDITASPYADAVYELYTGLGGVQAPTSLKIRVGTWDIQHNGVAVEFDEEQHFNHYRAYTLTSSVYELLSQFPLSLYKTYCETHEDACLKKASHGGYWSNENCERQFGTANVKGDLTSKGAPRWKQRAFYDFVKDLAPLVFGFNIVRIATWDTVPILGQQITLGKALKNPDGNVCDAVMELIKQRSYETLPPKA